MGPERERERKEGRKEGRKGGREGGRERKKERKREREKERKRKIIISKHLNSGMKILSNSSIWILKPKVKHLPNSLL